MAVLFLFFNLVCIAAPVLRLAGDNLSAGVPGRMLEVPKTSEGEEANLLSTASYVNRVQQLSLHRQNEKGPVKKYIGFRGLSSTDGYCESAYIGNAERLPLPGYYRYLFLHNLF